MFHGVPCLLNLEVGTLQVKTGANCESRTWLLGKFQNRCAKLFVPNLNALFAEMIGLHVVTNDSKVSSKETVEKLVEL